MKEHLFNKSDFNKVLIWGFGKTGRSIFNFFNSIIKNRVNSQKLIIIIDKTFSKEVIDEMSIYSYVQLNNEKNVEKLIKEVSLFFVSPGVKVSKEIIEHKKYFSEIDFFVNFLLNISNKKIFAITGSIGKTSTTKMLHHALSFEKNYFLGGNIGIPLFDFFNKNNDLYDGAVIEVSSVQLKLSRRPNFTVSFITNLYENHLDMHDSFYDYVSEKIKVYKYNKNCLVFLTKQAFDVISLFNFPLPIKYILVSEEKILNNVSHYYIEKNIIKKWDIGISKEIDLFSIDNILDISFLDNWLLIIAFLHELKYDINFSVKKIINLISIPDHRLEYIGYIKNKHIYNDSKSTIIESSIGAAIKLSKKNNNMVIIIGGLSKGVSRLEKLNTLISIERLKGIIFFGKEGLDLYNGAKAINPDYLFYFVNNLEDSYKVAQEITNMNDIILFSPGGSSFDQFKDYQHRGDVFKKIVEER